MLKGQCALILNQRWSGTNEVVFINNIGRVYVDTKNDPTYEIWINIDLDDISGFKYHMTFRTWFDDTFQTISFNEGFERAQYFIAYLAKNNVELDIITESSIREVVNKIWDNDHLKLKHTDYDNSVIFKES